MQAHAWLVRWCANRRLKCLQRLRSLSSAFRKPVRRRLLAVRSFIFTTAAQTPGARPLTETLKWGEPAYLTQANGSGSTIRLGQVKSAPRHAAILLNCRTSLVETFRDQFPDEFAYDKYRAMLLDTGGALPEAPSPSVSPRR